MTSIIQPEVTATLIPEIVGSRDEEVDLDALLPLEFIRDATKTDDIPSVTDDQLRLFRRAAFEQAELYTGRMLLKNTSITESASFRYKSNRRLVNPKVELSYPVDDSGLVVFHGGGISSQSVIVPSGSIIIPVPVSCIDATVGMCDKNGAGVANSGRLVTYRTGYKNANEYPAGILQGALKYISWSITNPGDTLLSQRGTLGRASSFGITGSTNNAAWASGALELWQTFVIARL